MSRARQDESHEATDKPAAKAPYSSPMLEVLGSLRYNTRGTSGMGADGGNSMSMSMSMDMMSDRQVKQDIVAIGRHKSGLRLYRYAYRAPYDALYGTRRHIGFMADEVAERFPDAVRRCPDGYLMVDYDRIPDGLDRPRH